ncbi:MAG TPA: ATP-binding cassette domain-containing protein [Caproiciproducens sp.]|nr:ATP-binding cassette domain-containing protein [Caproiciproducens sp.]
MAVFEIRHLSFTYPNKAQPALNDISLTVEPGEFVLLCGLSGCGKTTLLRRMKPALSPHGTAEGTVLFNGKPLEECSPRTQTAEIGYVMQSPEEQIVTDKVWHELAFGLESLGCGTQAVRLRTAEMASFFGIEAWFDRDTAELSGGQKQLLNLASILAMQPKALLLDEPTSQLDPIAAADFLAAVKKVNTELGVAVVLTEQRLQDAFPMADRVVVLDGGRVLLNEPPRKAGEELLRRNHPMALALPPSMRIYSGVNRPGTFMPMTVREGRRWLEALFADQGIRNDKPEEILAGIKKEPAVRLTECWFTYEKNAPDVLRNLSLDVPKSELFCIVGGNGTGKSTALGLIAGILPPYRGKVRVNGRVSMLPQNPQSLFLKSRVGEDMADALGNGLPPAEIKWEVEKAAELVGIVSLLNRHPYDLSGGEQQRAALAKVLLTKPDILLLDEPTKGLDSRFKAELARILRGLTASGVTVVMVSHDIEFCAEHADECALFFNGSIVAQGRAGEFFSGNSFYTTTASRMTRGLFEGAVTNKDVIDLCKINSK